MSARNRILNKLRGAQKPFAGVNPPDEPRQRVVNLPDTQPSALLSRFIDETRLLGCVVAQVAPQVAIQTVIDLIGADRRVLSWSPEYIPLEGLHPALIVAGITLAEPRDDTARVGITGADCVLSATGSLVLTSGAGRPRATSLLPDVHIALITPDQIVPDFEAWVAQERARDLHAFRVPGNTVIISGPSKTADIAQELIKGAHGPRVVHILIVG